VKHLSAERQKHVYYYGFGYKLQRFVEAFEKVHTVTMQNLAKMKTFDLKVNKKSWWK
jgi:hypothetical protein